MRGHAPCTAGIAAAVATIVVAGCAHTGEHGTVVLFDGTSWEGWTTRDGAQSTWSVLEDGSVLARTWRG